MQGDVLELGRQESDWDMNENCLPTATIAIARPTSGDSVIVGVDDVVEAVAAGAVVALPELLDH